MDGFVTAPPGEEDEEDGLRNGYDKGQENGTDRGQGGYKPRRNGTGGSTSGYGSGGSRSRRGDDSTRSPSQPKTMFNESEYTKITTPRQDLIFKKGYLSQKKPWASTASTSATPSTTESQSASHSTAGRGLGRIRRHSFFLSSYTEKMIFYFLQEIL